MMSYVVFCVFDLKTSDREDYLYLYMDLGEIGLRRVLKADDGPSFGLPSTAVMGMRDGNSADEVKTMVGKEVRSIFNNLRPKQVELLKAIKSAKQVKDDFRIAGPLEYRSLAFEASANLGGVDQIAVVGDSHWSLGILYQEGLRIPPIKLYEAGKLRDDLFDLLALNVRNPREFRGDLSAMLGAANLGERRLSRLFAEFGAPVVETAMEAILDATEQQTRAVVSTWKDGVFYGEAFLDDDGHGRTDIRIAAKVTKKGSDVEVDLSESDPQSTSFVNSSHANMQAAVAMAFAYLIDAEIPKNTGALRPLKVVARQGTIVWADPGRPVTLCTSHPSNEIVEAIVKALSASCPDRAMAGWSRRFRIAIQGEDPRSGKSFIWHLFQARPGGGASLGGDGWSSIGEWHSVGGLKFGSLEVAEVRFPLHFRTHEFRPGSGGDGQFRGGLGVSLDLVLETEKIAKGNTAGDGARHGPCGMLGGEDGQPHHYRLLSEGREPRVLRTKEVGIELRPGDCLEVRSSGGGGWGPPEKRLAEARQRDREQGLTDVAAEQASS